uniref:Uncharacterized protein n=1 Tax=viral metagenome TaxID=1070528 RepID=A0A6M3LJ64_9ZZZZ
MDRAKIFDYSYDYIELSFSEATANYEFQCPGEVIFCDAASSDFTIRLNSMTKKAITMKKGKTIFAPYDKIYISTTGANTIILFVASPRQIMLTANEVSVSQIDKLEKTEDGSYGHETIGAASVIIAASNNDRKRLTIQNWSANKVYIGFDNAVTTVNAAYVLEQYDSVDIDKYTGDVYGIAAVAGNDISYAIEGVA